MPKRETKQPKSKRVVPISSAKKKKEDKSAEDLFGETGKTPTTGWEYEHPDDHAEEEEQAG